ncbi:MAG: hypothetical protein GC179_26925 [Anaerolineaceae bacterium]|nr:hypothetical protein [Anaerolineaceae bacterium]
MDTQVTLTLPPDLYLRASNIAALTGWTVEDAVLIMLEVSLPALIPLVDLNKPVEALNDNDLIALTNLEMSLSYNSRHSELLYRQQAGTISRAEGRELQTLQRVYEIGMIYKSQALAEAVKRNLVNRSHQQ